jgi:hypothetical protein
LTAFRLLICYFLGREAPAAYAAIPPSTTNTWPVM